MCVEKSNPKIDTDVQSHMASSGYVGTLDLSLPGI